MKSALDFVVFALAVAITIASGALYGRMANRWGSPERMHLAAVRLESFPEQIGPWRQTETFAMDDTVIQLLQCENFTHARYVHQDTGQEVQVAVILGPHGPISVHTPEICYSGAGLRPTGQRRKVTVKAVDGSECEFWQNGFRTPESKTELIRVYYGWSTGDGWSASENPRWTFRGRPYLYKVQLAFTPAADAESEASDAGQQFLAAMVTETEAAFLHQ